MSPPECSAPVEQPEHTAGTSPPEDLSILLSIDWGTSKVAAAFTICNNKATSSTREPTMLCFNERDARVPMIATWYEEGKFAHGFELEELLRDEKVKSEDVIEFFKLALYDDRDAETSNRAERVREQLAQSGRSLHELFTEHLSAFYEDCRREIKRSCMRLHIEEEQLRRMPYKIRLSVPQMWSPRARQQMQNAAKAAGLPLVALASEPQCALACLVYNIEKGSMHCGVRLEEGDTILLADMGAGTTDIVGFKLRDALRRDSRFDAVSQEAGGRCAGQGMNDWLLELVENSGVMRNMGGIEEVAMRLGLTVHAFRRSLLQRIEEHKLGFEKSNSFPLAFRAASGGYRFDYDLSRAHFQAAFDFIGDKIISTLDHQTQQAQPKAIVVTGGLAKSTYLMKKIKAKYEVQGIIVVRLWEYASTECFHVPLGGLYRYDNITQQGLPRHFSYAFVQDEYYYPELHPDGTKLVKRPEIDEYDMPTGRYEHVPKTNSAIVKRRVHNVKGKAKQLVVYNRLKMFLPKEQVLSGDTVELLLQQEYFFTVNDPHLSATVVYLDGEFQDHEPALTADQEYRPGVVELNKVIATLNPADLEKSCFPITKNEYGESEYMVTALVLLKYKGERDMSVGWKVNSEKRGQNALIVWEDEANVWDANHSIFVDEPEPEVSTKATSTATDVDKDSDMVQRC